MGITNTCLFSFIYKYNNNENFLEIECWVYSFNHFFGSIFSNLLDIKINI